MTIVILFTVVVKTNFNYNSCIAIVLFILIGATRILGIVNDIIWNKYLHIDSKVRIYKMIRRPVLIFTCKTKSINIKNDAVDCDSRNGIVEYNRRKDKILSYSKWTHWRRI